MIVLKKGNNWLIIGLVGVIIVLLGIFLVLLMNNTITFHVDEDKNLLKNTKEEDDSDGVGKKDSNDSVSEKNPDDSSSYKITYEEEEYIPKRSDGSVASKSRRNLPKITNRQHQEIADKIVKYLTDISNDNWENNIKKMADDVVELPYDDLGVTYLYETGVVTDNRLTFLLKMNGGFGGVGWLSDEGFNFDGETGELLKLNNITDDVDALKKYMLNKISVLLDDMKKDENNCINDDYQKHLEEELNRDGNWYFTLTNIKINLPKYSVACGARGIIEIDLPKDEVNRYLKDKYKIK